MNYFPSAFFFFIGFGLESQVFSFAPFLLHVKQLVLALHQKTRPCSTEDTSLSIYALALDSIQQTGFSAKDNIFKSI